MAEVESPESRGVPRRVRLTTVEAVLGVLVSYVPFLLSDPGKLSSDTKQYLYTDPGQFLARVPWLWDSHVAAGTVSHQHIGYLFPMGPFYWVLAEIGVPTWVAQRLWFGTISLAAIFGARWLFTRLGIGRVGAAAGALVYVLSPYQLAFTARISVLLLPWAALPWIVGLTMRAARRGGWRDPALIALIVFTIGGVNASALLLIAIAPALWIVFELASGGERARAALTATARLAVLCVGVSLWWIAGLWAQGSYGLPVLQLTENVRTIAAASSPGDILRGLGNWFFYGYDRGGRSLIQAQPYLTMKSVVVASYAVPALALFVGAILRWRYRVYFAACIIVGTIVGVGAWPFDDPTPYGRIWKSFTDGSSVGLSLRNTPRAVPVVVLGIAGLIAAGVGAVTWSRLRALLASGVILVVAIALLPVWQHGFLTPGTERPNEIPAYWTDAIQALDRGPHSTRILEVPGSNFATYRWGNAVEPITPGLTTRPYLAREVLPYGSPESVALLDAFDRPLQNGSIEPTAIAPMARIFGVGTISLRSDLAYERTGSPHPQTTWATLTDPLAPGLTPPRAFGPTVALDANATDAVDLRTDGSGRRPPAVALFSVKHSVPIVHAVADRDPIVLSGDADGIVDLASGGLIDGNERVLVLASLPPSQLTHALRTGAALALTDTNRRRVSGYFASIRDTKGATARAGQTTRNAQGYGSEIDPYADHRDLAHTVVEQHGARVDASADGGADRPQDRATRAVDGDLRTAWRVGGVHPAGASIAIHPDHGVRTDHVDLVQPQAPPRDRWITRARITVNGQTHTDVALGPESFTSAGQRVTFPSTTVRDLSVQILATHDPTFDPAFANAVGFAEIRLGHVHVTETVRLPLDLARRVGAADAAHSLAIVLTRLRLETGTEDRQDEELSLDRRFVLPTRRAFAFDGTVRVNPDAPDATIDQILTTANPGTSYRSSSHLAGDLDARASRAFVAPSEPVGSSSAWTSQYGDQSNQWVGATVTTPVTTDHVDLSVVADARLSTPTALDVVADGAVIGSAAMAVPPTAAPASQATTMPVTIRFPSTTARDFRIVVRAAATPPGVPSPAPARVPPVSLTAIRIPGIAAAPAAGNVDPTCRTDILRVDGTPRGIRISGDATDARRGLHATLCDAGLSLTRGSHTVVTPRGWDSGIDVDRLALTSGRDLRPAGAGRLVPTPPRPDVSLRVTNPSPDHVSVDASVNRAGSYWLILGQSHNRGWAASAGGHDLGPPMLANGYANAWLVHAARAGTTHIGLRWTPQRTVWVALVLSGLAALLCLAILVLSSRRRRGGASNPHDLADRARLLFWSQQSRPTVRWTAILMIGVGVLAALVSTVEIALVAALVILIAARVPRTRPFIGLGAAATLMASRSGDHQELAWLALALFAATVAASAYSERDAQHSDQELGAMH